MINRLTEYLQEPEERPPAQDYWIVASLWEDFYVTRAVADAVMRELRRPILRRWLRFTDLNGSQVRIRAKLIVQVRECTRNQRDAARAFYRARELEDKPERRPWEED